VGAVSLCDAAASAAPGSKCDDVSLSYGEEEVNRLWMNHM
jgi:hypothetical protein